MSQPGSLANQVPDGPDWWIKKIRDLERRVSSLVTARSLQAAEIIEGGMRIVGGFLKIVEDGYLEMIDPASGNSVAYIGSTTEPIGNRQMIFRLTRDDGTDVLLMGDFGVDPGHAHQQALAWLDRQGNVVLADDTDTGWGIANPHTDGGLVLADTNIATWPATTNAAFTDIAFGWYQVQHPKVTFAFQLQADAATTGQFRVLVDGSQVATTQTVTGGFADWQPQYVDLPGSATWLDFVPVQLQARRTAGAGTVRGILQSWYGDQTPGF